LRGSFANQIGFIGQLDVERFLVNRRIDSDGFYTQPLTGANNPTGDLAPIGNQYLGKHNLPFVSRNGSPIFSRETTGPAQK
jgi:hypothetical protein